MVSSLKRRAMSGVFYRGVELLGMQGIQLLVSISLARLLLPEEFGVIALITVFLQVCSCLIVVGFPAALIQKKETTIEEESTVFYLNIIIAIVLYGLLFFCAPLISTFYDQETLTAVLRLTAVVIVINALGQIQSTLLTKAINFKALLKVNIFALIVSGITGVILAFQGFGVWALVWQQISSAIVKTVLLWVVSRWRPLLYFKISCVKGLFNFGYKLMLSGLIGSIFNNLYVLVIGKLHSPMDLAFYTRSKQLPWLVMNTTSGVISSVMFPTFSKISDDPVRLKFVAKKVLKMTYFVVTPLSIGLMICAQPLVTILLTEKWLPIVPYMQCIIIMYFCLPLQALNLEILKSLGRSEIYLKIEIIKKFLLVSVLFLTYDSGIIAILMGQISLSYVSVIIDTYYTKKLINYSMSEQLRDIFVSIVNGVIMGVICYIIAPYFPDHNAFKIIILAIVGAFLYIAFSYLSKHDSFYELLNSLKVQLTKQTD